jgi:putative isomerase
MLDAKFEMSGVEKTLLNNLRISGQILGKPAWRSMLSYVAGLHARSVHAPREPFPYPWEEIGPGYCYGPAFGHWDVVHQIFDVYSVYLTHGKRQILNLFAVQDPDGFLPGVVWMREAEPKWGHAVTHPPVWPFALEACVEQSDDSVLVSTGLDALTRQIEWFEANRRAEPEGFYYRDILTRDWESGVDEGVRFDDVQQGPFACVDATAHVYGLYAHGEIWAERLGRPAERFRERAAALKAFMQTQLYAEDDGFFYDAWAADDPTRRRAALEGMWPVVVGAATPEQANRVIDEHLLNPERFFTEHPVSTVGVNDSHFELRMWRGPTWNSMTYWAARGCMAYDRPDAARKLLEGALDASAAQFKRTHTIWEFYHPRGGEPETLERKPHTDYNQPCRDYLGHNPIFAMARLWERAGEAL